MKQKEEKSAFDQVEWSNKEAKECEEEKLREPNCKIQKKKGKKVEKRQQLDFSC